MWVNPSNQCECLKGYTLTASGRGCRIVCGEGYQYNVLTKQCEIIKPTCGVNMYVNTSNLCDCLTGYVLTPDGQSCRIICENGFKYNAAIAKC